MTIRFLIRFYTHPGQALYLKGDIPQLGNFTEEGALRCSYVNADFWEAELDIDAQAVARIRYKYLLKLEDGQFIEEGGTPRTIDTGKSGIDRIQVIDTWNHAGNVANVFYSAPFQDILLKEDETRHKVKSPRKFTHIFRVKAPLLQKHEVLCICGTSSALGDWKNPLLMAKENDWWSVKLELPPEGIRVEYKYGVYNLKEKELIRYEDGPNRVLDHDQRNRMLSILHDGFALLPDNTWKGAGVAIPVFSLRSKNSFGIGEFADLKLLADWARHTGLKLIQILPVNDTTATHTRKDSYPYSAISAFALHPGYINLEMVAGKKYASLIKPLKKKQKQLNDLPFVDYEAVMRFKNSVLAELFAVQKDHFLQDDGFIEFYKENRHWLDPYAAFCYLRDRNGTADFSQWKLYSVYDKAALEKYVSPKARHFDKIALQYFIQYHLHLQLKEAVQYAHKQGVILKGDIPIGIYRHGCDAWMQPELYHMELQAGAPPDDFAIKGQNWGFPTYNWEKMAEDNFQWWKQRFRQMSNYFDSFRIDHILGFFRIWSIPVDAIEGIMGYFVPSIPVHIHEFSQRGMWFNYHRLCMPYISDAVLWELFGPNNEKFYPFLRPTGNGHYELKEEFNTQVKVHEYIEQLPPHDDNPHLQQGLFDLISNVILFEKPGAEGREFFFRFNMEETSSFRHLDWHMQQQLKELYVDYFYKRQDEFWKQEAMKKLPALKYSTNMLICGEDLGMVPDCVPDVMKELGILSLEIQRMPKDPRKEFFHPDDSPYLAVVSPSTHDMSTIRGWWREDRQQTQRFYNHQLGQQGEAPEDCPDWICRIILLQHLYSPAIWSIFQLQDLMGADEKLRNPDVEGERINIPSDPKHYWRYRMHISLEELLREKNFNHQLQQDLQASGRA